MSWWNIIGGGSGTLPLDDVFDRVGDWLGFGPDSDELRREQRPCPGTPPAEFAQAALAAAPPAALAQLREVWNRTRIKNGRPNVEEQARFGDARYMLWTMMGGFNCTNADGPAGMEWEAAFRQFLGTYGPRGTPIPAVPTTPYIPPAPGGGTGGVTIPDVEWRVGYDPRTGWTGGIGTARDPLAGWLLPIVAVVALLLVARK